MPVLYSTHVFKGTFTVKPVLNCDTLNRGEGTIQLSPSLRGNSTVKTRFSRDTLMRKLVRFSLLFQIAKFENLSHVIQSNEIFLALQEISFLNLRPLPKMRHPATLAELSAYSGF